MTLTAGQTLITIGAVALGAVITRFLPFFLFPDHKPVPQYVVYLGKVLPAAVIGLLVVYCFKGVSLTRKPYGLPELLAVVSIVAFHKWKRNTLLSIGGGTLLYMFLVQYMA